MEAYICDKCGRVITLIKLKNSMTRLIYSTDDVGSYQHKHLCDDCNNKLANWFKEED
jgi:hypothetical protein